MFTRSKLLIAGLLVGVLLLSACEASTAQTKQTQANAPQTSTATTAPQPTATPTLPPPPTATPTPPPPPTATPVPPKPKVVLPVSGSGNKTTQTFTVSGEWQLKYSVQPNEYGVVFGMFIYPKGESTMYYDMVSVTQAGSETATEHDGGTYYLKVISGTPWSVTVTELPD